ncbi:MAG: hypothetical protein ACI3ZS_00510 [Candidatus Cryptobacteroides sp.]
MKTPVFSAIRTAGLAFLAAVSLFGFVSCGNEILDDGKLSFPMMKTIVDVEPGDEIIFEFDAEEDWALTSDRQWIRFRDEIGENASLEGYAGSNVVTIVVTADAQGFEGDKAMVEMTMDTETKVIAEIKRSAKEKVARMYVHHGFDEIEEVEYVDIAYLPREEAVRIGFEANFEWKFISAPEWVDTKPAGSKSLEDVNGSADQKITPEDFGAFFVKNMAKDCDRTGYVVIGEKDGDKTIEFEIRSAGIPAAQILWDDTKNVKGGVTWSYLGKIGDEEDAGNTAELHFITKDFDYELLYLDEKGNAINEENRTWLTVEDDLKGNIKVSAVQNEDGGDERAVYLGVMPKGVELAMYVKVDNNWKNLKSVLFPTNGFAFNVNFPFVVALKQDAAPGGFKLISQQTIKEWHKAERAENAEAIATGLNLKVSDNIWQYKFTEATWTGTSSVNLGIFPKGFPNDKFGSIKFYGSDYKEIISTEGKYDIPGWATGYGINPYWTDYKPHFGLQLRNTNRVPFADLPEGDLIIVFYDDNEVEVGTFVIKKS